MSAGRTLLLAMVLAAPVTAQGDRPYRQADTRERAARAAVVHAAYRYDDLLWENDWTAHRIYGRRLQAAEPPSGSGIDAWGKSVPWPFMDRQLRTGDQHAEHGEGVDFYNVGSARGAGGLGIWWDDKLWTSRNYARYRVIDAGVRTADFEVSYDPWPIGVERTISERRRFTLAPGTPFTRMVSTLTSNTSEALIVGIGISRRATDRNRAGTFHGDVASGRFTWWGPDDPAHGAMGVAVMVDPATIVQVVADADDHIVLVRATSGRPFVYYAGAAWSRGGRIPDDRAWRDLVASARPDFSVSKIVD